MKIDLSESIVLVTGATRGIGRSITEHLIKAGARVAVHYNQSAEAAAALAATGSKCDTFKADLSLPDESRGLVSRVLDKMGTLDAVINNAGIAESAPIDLDDTTWESNWRNTLEVNLTASGVISRAAIRHFQSVGGGRIVFVSSRAAFRGDTVDYMSYAASKGGMVSLSKSIARGFGKDGVKSFVIAPGFTRTELADDFIRQYGEELAMKDVALNRLTEPDDISPMVVLLVSGLADHATGTSIDFNAASYVR